MAKTKTAGRGTTGKKPTTKARPAKKTGRTTATKKAATRKKATKKAAKETPAGKRGAKKTPPRKPAAKKAPVRKRAPSKPQPQPSTVQRRTTPVSEYWRKLVECGWLDELPESEHRQLRERLAATLAQAPALAYQSLAVTSLDPECIEGSGPDDVCSYHSVIRQLADASFGRFQPEQIMDELDRSLEVARVSFCLGELSFHCEVPYRDEWVQPGVIDLVNRALEEKGVRARFRALPPDTQVLHFAFVSDEVYRRARQAGLIPETPPLVTGRTETASV